MSESPDRRDIDDLEERLARALAQLGWCLPVESSREDPSSDTLPAHLANPAEVFVWENGVPRCHTSQRKTTQSPALLKMLFSSTPLKLVSSG